MTANVMRRARFLVIEALYESETSDHEAEDSFNRRVREVTDEDPELAADGLRALPQPQPIKRPVHGQAHCVLRPSSQAPSAVGRVGAPLATYRSEQAPNPIHQALLNKTRHDRYWLRRSDLAQNAAQLSSVVVCCRSYKP